MSKDTPLSDEIFEKIKKQSIRNVVDRVRSGKIPTKAEWALLEEARCSGRDVPLVGGLPRATDSDAAMRKHIVSEFKISERKSYSWIEKLKHLKRDGEWDVGQVLAEIQDRKVAASGGPIQELKREKLEEEVKILRAKRMQVEGGLWASADVLASWSERNGRITNGIESARRHLTAKHRTVESKALIDEICDTVAEMVGGEFDA